MCPPSDGPTLLVCEGAQSCLNTIASRIKSTDITRMICNRFIFFRLVDNTCTLRFHVKMFKDFGSSVIEKIVVKKQFTFLGHPVYLIKQGHISANVDWFTCSTTSLLYDSHVVQHLFYMDVYEFGLNQPHQNKTSFSLLRILTIIIINYNLIKKIWYTLPFISLTKVLMNFPGNMVTFAMSTSLESWFIKHLL